MLVSCCVSITNVCVLVYAGGVEAALPGGPGVDVVWEEALDVGGGGGGVAEVATSPQLPRLTN